MALSNLGLSDKAPDEIIHELEQHQIELKIQNEELKKAHLDLETSQDRYIDLYDFAPIGYFTLTDEALIFEVNLTGAAMLGIDRRNLIHARFRKYVTAKDHDQWDRFFLNVLQHEGKQTCDLQIIRKKDTMFFGRIEGFRVVRSDESIQIRITMSDVTSRKQEENELLRKNEELHVANEQISSAEEELRYQYNLLASTEADLRQTKDNLENLISIANVPIVVWDLSFHITRLNQAAEILIGRSTDEVLGKPIDILFPPDLKDRSMRLLRTTHEGVRWETVELDILHQGGNIRTVLWNSATLYTPDGVTPVATIAQGQDVTDLKRLEKEKDASVAQIQKNLAQLAILNDEIRNPLTIIALYSDMIGSSEFSDKIIDQVHRIDLMIDQVDRRWNESEKILAYLRKHHQVYLKTSEDSKSEEIGLSSYDKKNQLIEEVQAELYTILDSIDALIYVADMDTYDLLYVNKRGRSLFGDITGKKCYQTIQKDQEGPCPFCTNHLLIDESGPTGVYQWEFRNTHNGRWYECRDRAIRWSDGRRVRLEIATDITERKREEEHQTLTMTVLQILNSYSHEEDTIGKILHSIQQSIGIEAVGIRLESDEDFPYYETSGFPDNFVETERSLCGRDSSGDVKRDASGQVILECMCGNIICGRTDPQYPFFTLGGSFWSNGTTALLASTTEQERQATTRKRCNGEGYESVALIPLHSHEKTIGLLQLNDRRKNRFTLEIIQFFEGLGNTIGIALDRTRSEEVLIESEKRYRAIYAQSPIAIELYDASGVLMHINPAGLKLFGIQDIQAIQNLSIFADLIITDREKEKVLSGENVQYQGPFDFEKVKNLNLYPTSREGIIWLDVFITPIGNGEKVITGFLVQITDITKRMLAEEALRQVNHKLHLLSNITRHDINNEIQEIFEYLDFVQGDDLDPKVRGFIENVDRSIHNIERQIAFTRDYQDIGVHSPVWYDVHAMITHSVQTLDISPIQIQVEISGIEIYADFLVEKVFYNLVDNAKRYGEKITGIRFSGIEGSEEYTIICEDDGVGVPDGFKSKIFNREYYKHTGFGLNLSREILEITGITIKETGKPGKGARFEILVPAGKFRFSKIN